MPLLVNTEGGSDRVHSRCGRSRWCPQESRSIAWRQPCVRPGHPDTSPAMRGRAVRAGRTLIGAARAAAARWAY